MNSIEDLKQACSSSNPYLRPFKPNVKWEEARVFIMGTNPATPFGSADFPDFEDYWDSLTRHPDQFETVYRAKYGAKKESKSSKRANHLLQALDPVNVLVTNAMIYPSRKPKEIKPNKRTQRETGLEAFRFLFQKSRPCAVLFHGSEALKLCKSAFSLVLDPHLPIAEQNVNAPVDWNCQLFAFLHFSGQGVKKGYKVSEMNAELSRLATRIKELV